MLMCRPVVRPVVLPLLVRELFIVRLLVVLPVQYWPERLSEFRSQIVKKPMTCCYGTDVGKPVSRFNFEFGN